jgi:hypothetical protein
MGPGNLSHHRLLKYTLLQLVVMTARLKVQSLEDKTDIDVIVTYEGDSTEACPAVIIAHPYGPLG